MRRINRGRQVTMALTALLALLGGGSGARATDASAVIVVFDGSGSMWGTIEGSRQSKLVLARDGLRQALGKLAPETHVGLAGFGHRRGDCTDVEVMLPPERLDVERIMAPLGPYNPRGKGPLTLALREAAKSLAERSGRKSLLLIHDEADNCQPDLCAAASELQAKGLTVHVVGLALKPADAEKMACLPQTTGGRLFNAANADQVGPAIEQAMRLASSDAGSLEPRPVQPQTAAAPVAPVPAEGPPGLYLRALLAPKADALAVPLHWTVSTEDASGPVLFDAKAANPVVAAAAGRYVVVARDGPVSARQIVEVAEKGPTAVDLVLNAGTLRIRAQAQKTGAALADAIITVSDAGQGPDTRKEPPAGPPLAMFKGSEGMAMLPAGRYQVRVEQGLVRAERAVVVPAGSQGRIDISLNAARVQLTAVNREGGGPLEAPVFSVVEDDPDAPRGRREVARSAARQAEFVLPPGTYYVIARQGGVEARERLAVGSGDVVRRTLAIAAGRLALSTKSAAGAQAPGELISYRIERIDGAPADLITTSRASPVLLLPGGRYRVEGRLGAMNARVVREVELKAGQTQQLVLEHQAATVKLRLLAAGGALLTEVFWDIRDEAGHTVWTTAQAEPSATLQAGRYAVRAETREKRYERSLELRVGEIRLFELAVD